MPRKITINDWKDKRDYNTWKYEVDGYNLNATHARYEDAVKVIAEHEKKRIGELKNTLWDAMVPFVGINITPPELKEAVERIMNSKGIEDILLELMVQEEKRVKEIEAAENARLDELKNSHEKLYEKYEKIKSMDKSKDSAAADSDNVSDEISSSSDSDGTADEVSTVSESESVIEETSENDDDYYMTNPEELDRMPEDNDSEDSET